MSEYSAGRNQIWSCTTPGCGLRFPVVLDRQQPAGCPRCGGQITAQTPPFGSHIIPNTGPNPGQRVEVVLDNLRSAWNVGSIFRTADAAGVTHLYLCGITPTPANPKTWKTSLGAEQQVSWSSHPDGLALVRNLKDDERMVYTLDGGPGSVSLFAPAFSPASKAVLVIGNEVSGVDPAILERSDQKVHIPMRGAKESLNTAVAFGIAVFEWMNRVAG